MHNTEFIARLKSFVQKYEHDQTQLAAAWREEWNKVSDKPVADATVPSRLSGLLKGKHDGIAFFFKNRRRAIILLELLDVPPDEHDSLIKAARDLLDGNTETQLLVLVALENEVPTPAAWTQLRQLIESPKTPRPVVLIVNEKQWESLPRSFDKIDGLEAKRMRETEARQAAEAVAAQGGLVATSAWGLVPYTHWIALDFGANALVAMPEGWREHWASCGQLPPLGQPTHPLNALDFEPAKKPPGLPKDLHAYARRLVAGDESIDPSVRLAHAATLKISAGATQDEVGAHQMRVEDAQLHAAAAAAEITVETLTPSKWEHLLARAKVRKLTAVCQVDDAWHWLNATPPNAFAAHRVHHHAIDTPEPTLTRLWAAVEQWSTTEYDADPMLKAVAARLDPEGKERTAFNLARAWIAEKEWPNWLKPAPVVAARPVDCAKTALLSRLVGRAPETELRLLVEGAKEHWTTQAEMERWQDEGLGLYRRPPRGEVLRVTRNDTLCTVGERKELLTRNLPIRFVPNQQALNEEAQDEFCDRLLQCLEPERVEDFFYLEKHWRQIVSERRYRPGEESRHRPALERYFGSSAIPYELPRLLLRKTLQGPFETNSVDVTLWQSADYFIAQLRRQLCTALHADQFSELPDGALLIPVRPDVEARVELTCTDDEPAIIIDAPPPTRSSSSRREKDEEKKMVWTTVTATHQLPTAIEMVGDGVHARITFVRDLLGLSKQVQLIQAIHNRVEREFG